MARAATGSPPAGAGAGAMMTKETLLAGTLAEFLAGAMETRRILDPGNLEVAMMTTVVAQDDALHTKLDPVTGRAALPFQQAVCC